MTHKDYCQSEMSLKSLRDSCTIVASVIKTYEDQEVIEIMTRLKTAIPSISFAKNCVLNDDIDIIISFNGIVYNVKNKEELIDFYKNINHADRLKKYQLVAVNNKEKLDNDYVIKYLIAVFQLKLLELSYSDAVKYIIENGIEYEGKTYSIDCVDLNRLYIDLISTINIATASVLANKGNGLSALNKMGR